MYVHIGGDIVVPVRDLVAIIDIASMERSASNQEFLHTASEEGFIEHVGDGPTNSWVITLQKVYASPISSLTLRKRAGFLGCDEENDPDEEKG